MDMEIYGEYGVYFDGAHVGHLSVARQGLMTEFDCVCVLAVGEILRLAVLSGDTYKVLGVMLPEGDKLRYRKRYTKNDLTRMSLVAIDGCKLVRPADPLTPDGPPASDSAAEDEGVEEAGTQKEAGQMKAETPPEAKKAEEAVEHGWHPEPETATPPEAEWIREETPPVPQPVPPPEMVWRYEKQPWALFTDSELQEACRNIRGALRMDIEGITLLAIPFRTGEPFPAMPIFCFGETMKIQETDYLIFKIKNGNLVG